MAFGGNGPPRPLSGGEGVAWQAGDIVLKPAAASIEGLEWLAAVLGAIDAPTGFRVAQPRRAGGGALTVEGWQAFEHVAGRLERGRWADVIRAGDAFHAAIAHQARPSFLDLRDDRWAIADRVAWGELPLGRFADLPHVARLAAARQAVPERAQLIHGDLTGNVLFADPLPPAIIDLSPYWRPAPFASAVVIADALAWEGADSSVLQAVTHIAGFGRYLVRALIFRIASDPPWVGAQDPYASAVDLALNMRA